jgi:hypothetical protein
MTNVDANINLFKIYIQLLKLDNRQTVLQNIHVFMFLIYFLTVRFLKFLLWKAAAFIEQSSIYNKKNDKHCFDVATDVADEFLNTIFM